MKRLIEFPLRDGSSMIVEVDEPETSGSVTRSARPAEVIEKAKQTFDDALDKITPAAQMVVSKLRGLHDEPDEIEVEFGIKRRLSMWYSGPGKLDTEMGRSKVYNYRHAQTLLKFRVHSPTGLDKV